MSTKKTFLEAILITVQLINDVIFMCESRTKPSYFTRAKNCKMDFESLILFQLNFVRKSIQLELDDFFQRIKGSDHRITKQAFSEARQKISPKAFVKMADHLNSWFYGDNDFKTFLGYRLCAIDASIFEVNNSKRLRDAFGYGEGKLVKLARAKASGIYDLLNDMMLTSTITHYKMGERQIAVKLIEKLKELGLKNDLLLFDRGYPGKDFFAYLHNNNIKFLMRMKSSSIVEVNAAKKPDQAIELHFKGQIIPLRVVRFLLDTGEEEVLVTNLLEEKLTLQEFKMLYFRRWGIEVKYDELKSRLQIENFTGDTVISVEQDFYATIFLSNLIALAKREANEKIALNNEKKDLKYEYKVNNSILIGKLKDSLVLMILENDPQKRVAMIQRIIDDILKNLVPIRPGRSNYRRKGLKAHKHPMNQKRCL